MEALLWTAVPPVEETLGFVEDAIEKELDWLNTPPGAQKSFSFALFSLFPIVLFVGLWRHSRRLLAASAGLIVVFYFLMRRCEVLIGLGSIGPYSPGCRERCFLGSSGEKPSIHSPRGVAPSRTLR